MDEFKLIISLAALALGIFNFIRAYDLESKTEYKSKHNLYQECMSEAKLLIEKIDGELAEIDDLRNGLMMTSSAYLNSLGSNEGHKALYKDLDVIQSSKVRAKELFSDLDGVVDLTDKEAFDKCLRIRTDLKNLFVTVNPHFGTAKNRVKAMKRHADIQA